MEYKKNYKFMVFGPGFAILCFLIIGTLIGLICMLVFCLHQEGIIAGIVIVCVLLSCLIWFALEMFLYVRIDKEKIELIGYKGLILEIYINEISKIEMKPAFKGDYYFEIFGTQTNNNFKKTFLGKGKSIYFPANSKTINVLKYFVPNNIFLNNMSI